MDEHRDEFQVKAVAARGVSRSVPIATFLVGIFLGAALVKPWDLVFPASPTSTDRRPTSVAASSTEPTPTATPTPSPSGPSAECAFAGGWRVFALGQPDPLGGDGSTSQARSSDDPPRFADIGNPLRRWLEVDPLTTASGPGDLRIPFVTIVSDRIGGIGYCPPPDGKDGPPAEARFHAWLLDDTRAALALPLRAVTLDPATAVEVAVYIGADHPVGRGERWPPGQYVFAVESPDAGAYGRWFGVEIRTPPGRLPN
jgi:hypothetical protein